MQLPCSCCCKQALFEPTDPIATGAGALAALGQALIPFYTGRIIDYASIDPDTTQFEHTIVLLVLVSLGCSIFTGIRGGAKCV